VVLWRDALEAFIALRERQPHHRRRGHRARRLPGLTRRTISRGSDRSETLGLGHGNRYRQTRRLRQLLAEAVELDALIDVYGAYVATPVSSLRRAKAVGRELLRAKRSCGSR
jgi:hypothetical protein